jgi:hypothetical protein
VRTLAAIGTLALLSFAAAIVGTETGIAAGNQIKAGAAAVDASWHVGASAGQYASDGSFVGVHPEGGAQVDPGTHSYRRSASYGIQSRLSVRAIVVEGTDGKRIAMVKNDLYIPQDLVYRRTAQLLEAGDSGINRHTLTMAATHNHSSPMYTSTSWGVWAFQDVFDVRYFDYMAKRMAAAVEQAADNLKPARVGASVSSFDKTHRHSFGPAVADDGTPAGYPQGETDHDMSVVRFDDVSNPADPKPIANLVNYSLHPEFLEGNDLISADYVGPLQRMADRETGALTIWTQGAVGTSEPERSTYHSIHERLEFSHKDYAQAEYGARLMTDKLVDTWRDIERETPEQPNRFVPFRTSVKVGMEDRWFPGPVSHPYPGVSSCRSDPLLAGDPRVPVVGLPDCQNGYGVLNTIADVFGVDAPVPPPTTPIDPGLSTDDFQAAGIPIPENYSFPSYTGLQEDVSVHLQAFRLGDILFTLCSCEQWFDQSNNIETRTDRVVDNIHLGYDWGARCTDTGDNQWTCPNPHNPSTNLPPITDHEYLRMRAQVLNDAVGWNNLQNVAEAESEPTDTTRIKGNYTQQELSPALGYKLTVPISMANDYNGYIATYREYQRGDHYRKALTGWGPHSSDYMSSRLVAMGGRLNGGPNLPYEIGQAKVIPDQALNDQRAHNLGEVGNGIVQAYEAGLPDDGGSATAISQPQDIERFSAAFFTWNGGSNFTDNPRVKVQRRVDGQWEDYAGQSGEIPVTVRFPVNQEVQSYALGDQQWHWTAHFEAFASDFETIEGNRATPVDTYRFVVDGERRKGGARAPYHLESDSFRVKPWDGITIESARLGNDGSPYFKIGPRRSVTVSGGGPTIDAELGPIDYPDSYSSPARFIRNQRTAYRDPSDTADPRLIEWFCFTCTFRPWADTGDAEAVHVTLVLRDGTRQTIPAHRDATEWTITRRLDPGESAYIAAGGVTDYFGNINGANSAAVAAP